MKKLINYLSLAFIFALVYCIVPVAHATEEPSYNHRKECFWHHGCKPKDNRSCFGAACGETPEGVE